VDLIAVAKGEASTATTVDTSTTLNIQDGDVLVFAVGYAKSSAQAVSVAETDGTSNPATMLAEKDNYERVLFGYNLNAEANASATFRVTIAASSYRVSLIVYQFRPAAGETVALDAGPSGAGGSSTAPQSGALTTIAASSVVFGMISAGSSPISYSDPLIAGSAPDRSDTTAYALAEYTAFTSTQTGIRASATLAESKAWAAQAVSFSITSSGGSSPVPKIVAAYMGGR